MTWTGSVEVRLTLVGSKSVVEPASLVAIVKRELNKSV